MKKILCTVVMLFIVIGVQIGASASGAVFSDIKDTDWYYPYIELLAQKDLVRGTSDNEYSPDKQLMVDEFLAFALRTMGMDQENAEGYWAQNYITEAIRLNLIDENEFPRYDVPISREKIAKIAVRASDYEYKDYISYENIFSDFAQAREKEYILKAIELGVLAGYDDGTFKPAAMATRAEASAIVVRMIDPSYRLQLIGNVFFSPKLDLNENGNVKKEKVFEFVMEAVKKFTLRIDGNGKVVIKGYIPEVPQGQLLTMNVTLFSKSGKILDMYTTTSQFDEYKIPPFGAFEKNTDVIPSQVAFISINATVSNEKIIEYTAMFSIYKDYIGEFPSFFIREDYVKMTYLDFSLTEGIWGW